MRHLLIACLFCVMLGLTQKASANVVFQLTDGNLIPSIQSSFVINSTDNSHSLTATASAGSNSAQVVRSLFGMGVYSGGFDDLQLDGVGGGEVLHLTLDSPLQLESTSFSFVGGNDEFTLTVDNNFLLGPDIPGGGGVAGFFDVDTGTFNFSSLTIQGLLYDFGVTDSNDDYKLTCITFLDDLTPDPHQEPVVPEPATLALIGMGLSLGHLARRRRV